MSKESPAAIVRCFEDLEDPRLDRNKEHKLIDVLVIAICGVICGCESHTQIARYGEHKKEWLATFLELANGIPSHDTFSRVFRRLDAAKFAACFRDWVASLASASNGKLIAIDGKTLRHSFDGESSPLHLVSAWASECHLSLGQVATDAKSNEITAIPKLLELIDLAGGLVTIDAMGCQKDIAAKIRDEGADYVLAVKENQPHLYEDIHSYFLEQLDLDFATVHCSRHETHCKGHGREESRFYYQVDVPEHLRHLEEWRDLRTIGMAVQFRRTKDEEQTHVRYYISSLGHDAKRFAEAVRGHWGIENSLHWVLDVTFDEDQCRIRKDHGAENFATLRRLAVSLLKQERSTKDSIRTKRKVAGWDNKYLLKVLTAKTP